MGITKPVRACRGSVSALWGLAQAGSCIMLLVSQVGNCWVAADPQRCMWQRVWPPIPPGHLNCSPCNSTII